MINLDVSKLIHKTTVVPRLLNDTPTQKLLPIATQNDLLRLARKTATAELVPIPEAKFDIKPKHSYILLISVGGGEFWGFNENADKYPEGSKLVVTIPEPQDGKTFTVTLGKGLKETHSTFSRYGAVYRNHKTEPADGVPRSGEIVWERWRPDMHWGELIVELPHNKWEKELADYEQGIPLMWSQGSGVPKDVCFPENTLITTDRGLRPIQHVLFRDVVMTHDGKWRIVSDTIRRKYTGDMVTLCPTGIPEITSTGNHPVLIIPKDKMYACHGSVIRSGIKEKRRHTFNESGVCVVCGERVASPVWKDARDVKQGDFVLSPVSDFAMGGIVDESLAYILGAYAGDGHIVKERRGRKGDGPYRDYGVGFTLSMSDPGIFKLAECIQKVTGKSPNLRPYKDGKKAVTLSIYHRELAAACRASAGTGSLTKRVDATFSSIGATLSFLGGYIDTDGSFDRRTEGARVVTCSRELAYSVRSLAIKAGLRPSLRSESRKANSSGFKCSTSESYWLFFGPADTKKLENYSTKIGNVSNDKVNGSNSTAITLEDGTRYIGYAIREVKTAQVVDMPVYNLSVMDKQSYVAGGIAVHNCSRCGFEYKKDSKSRCSHIKNQKLCIPADGIPNCLLCSDATFYDISYVGNNPAAKIAWGIMKVAESGIDPEDASSWKPIVPIFNRSQDFKSLIGIRLRPAEPVLSSLRAEEESILPGEADAFRHTCAKSPEEELKFVDVCKSCDPSDLLSTLSRTKIILTPTQWWRIFNTAVREPSGVSGFCGALSDVYRRVTEETDRDFLEDAGWLPSRCPDISLLNRLSPFAGNFSPRPDIKLEIVIKNASSERYSTKPKPSATDLYLAREYARYQTACLTSFADPDNARWCALVNAAGI